VRTWANTHPQLRTQVDSKPTFDVPQFPRQPNEDPFHVRRRYWLTTFAPRAASAPSGESAALPIESRALSEIPSREAAAIETENSFREEGEYWQITYEGSRFAVRNLKGLFYIQFLLTHPEERVHVSQLAALADRGSSPAVDRAADSAVGDLDVRTGPSDAGEVLDARATREYKARIVELRAELDEATRWADLERADSIRHEIGFLTTQLVGAYSRNGAVRKMGDPSERARKAVTKCMREAIDRITKQHFALGRHLANAIHMGFHCCYSPEPPIRWRA